MSRGRNPLHKFKRTAMPRQNLPTTQINNLPSISDLNAHPERYTKRIRKIIEKGPKSWNDFNHQMLLSMDDQTFLPLHNDMVEGFENLEGYRFTRCDFSGDKVHPNNDPPSLNLSHSTVVGCLFSSCNEQIDLSNSRVLDTQFNFQDQAGIDKLILSESKLENIEIRGPLSTLKLKNSTLNNSIIKIDTRVTSYNGFHRGYYDWSGLTGADNKIQLYHGEDGKEEKHNQIDIDNLNLEKSHLQLGIAKGYNLHFCYQDQTTAQFRGCVIDLTDCNEPLRVVKNTYGEMKFVLDGCNVMTFKDKPQEIILSNGIDLQLINTEVEGILQHGNVANALDDKLPVISRIKRLFK